LDGVFTDPPYFGNVQYAELMDFCYAWLRKLAGKSDAAFEAVSTRHVNELTANEDMQRGPKNFTEGLSAVFNKMANALKPGAPLVFTYHHNALSAYYPIAVAVLDAGLTCSASLPCPAEMGASIHIKETGSSIVDTIFVCRSTGEFPRRWLPKDAQGLALVVEEDLDKLRQGKVKIAYGDIRCIVYGHLTRLAIWALRKQWKKEVVTEEKLERVGQWIDKFGALAAVEKHLNLGSPKLSSRSMMVHEPEALYRVNAQISF
jgi:putative DNA methylase